MDQLASLLSVQQRRPQEGDHHILAGLLAKNLEKIPGGHPRQAQPGFTLAQLARGRTDTHRMGMRHQVQPQSACRLRAAFLDQLPGWQAAGQRHRQQRLVVHVGRAGAQRQCR